MSDDPKPTIQIVYMGQYPIKGGKLGSLLIPVERLTMLLQANAPAGTITYAASPFTLKKSPFAKIGGIYSVEGKVDPEGVLTTIVSSTAKWTGKIVECDLVGAWEANDMAYRAELRAEQAHNRASNNRAFDGAIRDLRWIYWQVPATNRNAFKLMLLNELDKRP